MKSNIRKLRNEKQISQTTLANAIGKTQQAISHMEKDRDRISIENLIAIADYFGVSTDYVLGVDDKDHGISANERDSLKNNEKELTEVVEDLQKIVNSRDGKFMYELIISLLLCSLNEKAIV